MRRNHPDEKFVYIAVYKEYAEANGFKIIPIHPLSQGAAVYDYTKGMAMIDWETMNRKEFDDAHCKLVCLAECMSPTSLNIRQMIDERRQVQFYVKSDDDGRELRTIYRKVTQQDGSELMVNVNEYMFR